jgi:hypothetical protein
LADASSVICTLAVAPGALGVVPVMATTLSAVSGVAGATYMPFCELTRPTSALPPAMPLTAKFMNVPVPSILPTSHSLPPGLMRVSVAWMPSVAALAGMA